MQVGGVDAKRLGPELGSTAENSDFWNHETTVIKIHRPVAATASAGHHASLRVDLIPVESPSRSRQGESAKSHEHVTGHDTSIEGSGSHVVMIRQHGMR
ncbi:hypothetical protein K469DRAFT_49279 [Zopfia rhizophila CBS 207.26]|uniref:Uncharacterized protein n=1 Tax=Zopfia rhizophila CBS 207.26 TaxID=1314779 RepID=A0A6A6EGR1_9PEZI|nr:hypothetical protein K469DRAFT_49279 [Zopfia rhizophila CBS 207.26]